MDTEMIDKLSSILMKHNPQTKTGAVIVVVEMLTAMREPTQEMLQAAFNDYAYREKSKLPWNGKAMYQAMIDRITNG